MARVPLRVLSMPLQARPDYVSLSSEAERESKRVGAVAARGTRSMTTKTISRTYSAGQRRDVRFAGRNPSLRVWRRYAIA